MNRVVCEEICGKMGTKTFGWQSLTVIIICHRFCHGESGFQSHFVPYSKSGNPSSSPE